MDCFHLRPARSCPAGIPSQRRGMLIAVKRRVSECAHIGGASAADTVEWRREGDTLKNTNRGADRWTGAAKREPQKRLAADDDALSSVRALGKRAKLRPGQRFALTGVSSGSYVVVTDGTVFLQSEWDGCPRLVLSILQAGEAIACDALPAGGKITLSAAVPGEVVTIDMQMAVQAGDGQSGLGPWLMRAAQEHQARLALHLVMIGGLSAEQRLATLLVDLALRRGPVTTAEASFDLPLSRTEMADYLALNADTLSRVMSQLKMRGLVHQPRRDRLIICDWPQLCALSPLSPSFVGLATSAGPRAHAKRPSEPVGG